MEIRNPVRHIEISPEKRVSDISGTETSEVRVLGSFALLFASHSHQKLDPPPKLFLSVESWDLVRHSNP